jgi:hypothetical protein
MPVGPAPAIKTGFKSPLMFVLQPCELCLLNRFMRFFLCSLVARSFYCFPRAALPTLSALAIQAKRIPNLQNRKFVNFWEKNADVETAEVEKVKYLTSRHW